MSKYNLTDILEQYRIGSGWTTDFDYDGMLKAGLKAGVDTDIEVLKKMSDDFEDVNYHRENNHLQNAIEALEDGAIKEASMFFGDFHAEIQQTIKDQGMDIEPTLGKFMDAKMDMMNEDEFDEARQSAIESSQEAAGIKEDKYDDIVDADDDIPADKKKEAAAAYRKVDKGASYEKATSHIKEVSSREGSRIESLLNQQLKAKFLNYFEELFYDLVEEDPFHVDDVIDHLSIEMGKRIYGNQMAGDRLAGLGDFEQEEFTAIDEEDKKKKSLSKPVAKDLKKMKTNFSDLKKRLKLEEDPIEEALPKFKGVPEQPSIIRALKVDGNGTKMEIDSYMASLKRSGDEFDDVDDYVEDFKNYVADKALQEHFGRFMKDYQ